MSAISERFRAAKERRKQRRAGHEATKGERAQRKAQADAIRLEHKRRGGGSGGGGGGVWRRRRDGRRHVDGQGRAPDRLRHSGRRLLDPARSIRVAPVEECCFARIALAKPTMRRQLLLPRERHVQARYSVGEHEALHDARWAPDLRRALRRQLHRVARG